MIEQGGPACAQWADLKTKQKTKNMMLHFTLRGYLTFFRNIWDKITRLYYMQDCLRFGEAGWSCDRLGEVKGGWMRLSEVYYAGWDWLRLGSGNDVDSLVGRVWLKLKSTNC